MSIAYLCLGSNLGDRAGIMEKAIREISGLENCSILRQSAMIETKAYGLTDQPDFLNSVIEIRTTLEAHALLKELLRIETELGRTRGIKWGPRLIDIDILIMDDLVISDSELCLPHPDFHRRRFALVLLAELAPNLIHPSINKPISQLLNELDNGGI